MRISSKLLIFFKTHLKKILEYFQVFLKSYKFQLLYLQLKPLGGFPRLLNSTICNIVLILLCVSLHDKLLLHSRLSYIHICMYIHMYLLKLLTTTMGVELLKQKFPLWLAKLSLHITCMIQ